MSKKKIHVILADDHAVVLMGLTTVLSLEPDIVIDGTAENGMEALELFRKFRPLVILLDLRMPGTDGLTAARNIRGEFPDARIIFLTSYDTEEEVHQAIKVGAAGFLLKRSKRQELVTAVRTVAAGGQWIPEEIASRIRDRECNAELSPRQCEVLELVAKGLSNKDIANLLGFSESGAKQHLRQIFTKLGVVDRAEAVAAAIQRGIIRTE
jgi:two-component system, NarL family, response regulator